MIHRFLILGATGLCAFPALAVDYSCPNAGGLQSEPSPFPNTPGQILVSPPQHGIEFYGDRNELTPDEYLNARPTQLEVVQRSPGSRYLRCYYKTHTNTTFTLVSNHADEHTGLFIPNVAGCTVNAPALPHEPGESFIAYNCQDEHGNPLDCTYRCP